MKNLQASICPVQLVTVEEYSQWVTDQSGSNATLLQFGSQACSRCPAFGKEIESLCNKYQFRWAYNDAHHNDTDLPEHFIITQLPAFVLKIGTGPPVVVNNSTPDQVVSTVSGKCTPVLTLDDDF
jgi:thioredoxin-like negative regulator of GroEL